jgi:hypothetical protein
VNVDQLSPLLLVQDGEELLKVNAVYGPDRITAQVVFPPQAPPATRHYTAVEVERWTGPTQRLLELADPRYP